MRVLAARACIVFSPCVSASCVHSRRVPARRPRSITRDRLALLRQASAHNYKRACEFAKQPRVQHFRVNQQQTKTKRAWCAAYRTLASGSRKSSARNSQLAVLRFFVLRASLVSSA